MPLSSTVGEVDPPAENAECLGAVSFRSGSPQRADELPEVESSNTLSYLRMKKSGEGQINPRRTGEKQR